MPGKDLLHFVPCRRHLPHDVKREFLSKVNKHFKTFRTRFWASIRDEKAKKKAKQKKQMKHDEKVKKLHLRMAKHRWDTRRMRKMSPRRLGTVTVTIELGQLGA